MNNLLRTLFLAAALSLPAAHAEAGDAAEGKKIFKKCAVCHTIGQPGKKKIGPDLAGIYGRKAAGVAGFKYSVPMKNANLTWDAATLDRFLENPRKMVAKTRMVFMGLKNKKQREDLIEFLKQAK